MASPFDFNSFLVSPPAAGSFHHGQNQFMFGQNAQLGTQAATPQVISGNRGAGPNRAQQQQHLEQQPATDQVFARQLAAFESTMGLDLNGGFRNHGSSTDSGKFDPNDYSAQGLDDSAFSSVVPFKMPNFLMGGPAGDFSEGPAVLEPPTASMGQVAQPTALQTPPDPGSGLSISNNFNPHTSSPVFGMYGSSVVGVNAESRPSKKAKVDKDDEEISLVQRNDGRHRPGYQSASSSSAESRDDAFDASHLGLPPAVGGNFPGLYSESGFDLLGVLARVVARPNPIINVGPVDTSASIVVCDARRYDFPIVFASKTFSHLTGYDSSEILGRNCRFLQSPTGAVEKGAKRKDTDGRAVKHIQKHIDSAKECQASLINYRKNGEPFINLVTIVPITWDSDEITYYVGFQVNLIEQPNAILDRMKNGTYVINYTLLPEPPGGFEPAREVRPDPSHGHEARDAKRQKAQLALSNEALDRLGDTLADDAESKKHWFETLIENCDDMIHVLSLKGSLLYVSPAVESILGYTPGELLGKNLQGICHPSDWIAVMRELKESSQGEDPNVHLLFRVRRKNAGFVWIESQGRLYNENGKGRKCVILVARERPVYRMSWAELQSSGGFGEAEVWYKMSLDGSYLYVSPTVAHVLGFEASAMVGATIDQTLPAECRKDFLVRISQAAAGRKASLHHHILNRQRELVEVVTNFWPSKSDSQRDGHLNADMPNNVSFVVCQTNEIKSEHRRVRSAREFAHKSRPTPSTSSSYSGTPALVTREVAGAAGHGQHPSASPASAFSAVPSTYKFMRGHPAARRDNVFNELDTAHSSSWLYEIHLLENLNKKLAEERDALLSARSRKKRTFSDFASSQSSCSDSPPAPRACANCGKINSPEWRRGPGGVKSLCNACGLRWSKAQHQASSSSMSTSASTSVGPASTHTSGSAPSRSDSGSESRMSSSSQGLSESPATLSVPPYHSSMSFAAACSDPVHSGEAFGSPADPYGGMPSRHSYFGPR